MKSTTTTLLRAADRDRLDLEPGAPWLAAVDFDRAGDPHPADPAAAGAGTTTRSFLVRNGMIVSPASAKPLSGSRSGLTMARRSLAATGNRRTPLFG